LWGVYIIFVSHWALEIHGYLEQNLLPAMAFIVTSKAPLLTAAQVNMQVEFDRT
jgi:hypothetical protein